MSTEKGANSADAWNAILCFSFFFSTLSYLFITLQNSSSLIIPSLSMSAAVIISMISSSVIFSPTRQWASVSARMRAVRADPTHTPSHRHRHPQAWVDRSSRRSGGWERRTQLARDLLEVLEGDFALVLDVELLERTHRLLLRVALALRLGHRAACEWLQAVCACGRGRERGGQRERRRAPSWRGAAPGTR